MSFYNYLKIFFIVFSVYPLLSCEPIDVIEEDSHIEQHGESKLSGLVRGDFEIIVIDRCEYLIYTEDFDHSSQGFGFMAHKGNCHNPIHNFPQTPGFVNDTLVVTDTMPVGVD